jgi:hypothetical protein
MARMERVDNNAYTRIAERKCFPVSSGNDKHAYRMELGRYLRVAKPHTGSFAVLSRCPLEIVSGMIS